MNSVKTTYDILMMILPACSGITYLNPIMEDEMLS